MMAYALNTQTSTPATRGNHAVSSASPITAQRRQGHLKRLSLGTDSLAGATNSSPTHSVTSTSPSTARSNTGLRSLSTGRDLGTGPDSDSSTNDAKQASNDSPSATRTRGAGSGSHGTPTSARHTRRTSSIAYARSPDPTFSNHASDSITPSKGATRVYPRSDALSPSTSIRESRLGASVPPLGLALGFDQDTGSEANDADNATTPTQFESPRPNATSSDSGIQSRHATPGTGTLASRRAEVESARRRLESNGAASNTVSQPTLTEANADLLSFIAKKERKCLDLREDLRRHEEELAQLKKKWEGIVAKSLRSDDPPTTTSMPRLSPDLMKRASSSTIPSSGKSRHSISSSTSSTASSAASPHSSPTPRNNVPLHSLDMSLLSSTFDADHVAAEYDSPELELSESVQAAKAWMGGMFGKVLEAVGGTGDEATPAVPLSHHPGSGSNGSALDVLREEDEDNEYLRTKGDQSSAPTGFEASLDDPKRTARSLAQNAENEGKHKGSLASTSSVSSSVSDPSLTGSHIEQAEAVFAPASTNKQPVPHRATKPGPVSSSSKIYATAYPPRTGSVTSELDAAHPRHTTTASHSSAAASSGHARTRSTLDMLSGGWSSFNKRLTAVTESPAFQNSKRATLGLVDTFENGLAAALGPLEPPPLEPLVQHGNEHGHGHERERRGTDPEAASPPPPLPEKSLLTKRPPTGGRESDAPVEPGSTTGPNGPRTRTKDEFDWSSFEDPSEVRPSKKPEQNGTRPIPVNPKPEPGLDRVQGRATVEKGANNKHDGPDPANRESSSSSAVSRPKSPQDLAQPSTSPPAHPTIPSTSPSATESIAWTAWS